MKLPERNNGALLRTSELTVEENKNVKKIEKMFPIKMALFITPK